MESVLCSPTCLAVCSPSAPGFLGQLQQMFPVEYNDSTLAIFWENLPRINSSVLCGTQLVLGHIKALCSEEVSLLSLQEGTN